jgi:TetR/AcrR family transcriptional regulator, cholesterol catabolism regulator
MNKKKQNGSDKFSEIIDTAARLFEEKGFKSTTIREIAKAVNLTQGSLYYHVRSKEEILFEIQNQFLDEILKRRRKILSLSISAKEKIRKLVEELFDVVLTKRSYIKVVLNEYKSLPLKELKIIREKRKRYDRGFVEAYEQGVGAGEFRTIDSLIASFALMGMVNWSYQWVDPEGSLKPQEIADVFLDIFFHGVCNKEASM